jgi:hypothetical protein
MIGECKFVNPEISEFYISEWESTIVPIYSANNVIDHYEWANIWSQIKINTAVITHSQEMNTNVQNGIYYKEVVSIIIPKAENSKWLDLTDFLYGKKYIVVYKDANGIWFTGGYRWGVQARSYQLSENQYVVSFESSHHNNLPTLISETYVNNSIIVSPTPSPTPSISVSPSVTPSISISPSSTPSISVTPSTSGVPPSPSPTPSITPSASQVINYIGFDSVGALNISAANIGNAVLTIDITFNSEAGQSYIGCEPVPQGGCYIDWTADTQTYSVQTWATTCSQSNPTTHEQTIDNLSFTGITSGTTSVSCVQMSVSADQCGDSWAFAQFTITNVTKTSGDGNFAVDPVNNQFSAWTDVC